MRLRRYPIWAPAEDIHTNWAEFYLKFWADFFRRVVFTPQPIKGEGKLAADATLAHGQDEGERPESRRHQQY